VLRGRVDWPPLAPSIHSRTEPTNFARFRNFTQKPNLNPSRDLSDYLRDDGDRIVLDQARDIRAPRHLVWDRTPPPVPPRRYASPAGATPQGLGEASRRAAMRRHGARSSSCGGGGLAGSLALVREERCEGIGPCSLPRPNPKYFLCHPSHQNFERIHGALNVGKKNN
jgi:hypothetical protein